MVLIVKCRCELLDAQSTDILRLEVALLPTTPGEEALSLGTEAVTDVVGLYAPIGATRLHLLLLLLPPLLKLLGSLGGCSRHLPLP
jgi:hypothetical protein